MEFIENTEDLSEDVFMQGMFEKHDDLPDIERTIMKILLLSLIIVIICLIFLISLLTVCMKRPNKTMVEKEGKLEVVTFVLEKPTTFTMQDVPLDN